MVIEILSIYDALGVIATKSLPREEHSQIESLTACNLQGHRFQLRRGANLFREEDLAGDLYGVVEALAGSMLKLQKRGILNVHSARLIELLDRVCQESSVALARGAAASGWASRFSCKSA